MNTQVKYRYLLKIYMGTVKSVCTSLDPTTVQ